MDEEHLQPRSDNLPNQSGKTIDNGGNDRISELPDEILFVILSLLPVRRAASTTLLSSRWLDLWKRIPNLKFNLEFDRISQLPDQIISLILSFLPLKKAAATSVLSSRWSDSWKHTPILNFDYDTIPVRVRPDPNKYIEKVNSILLSHKALSLKWFRLCFYANKSTMWAVTKWLELVFLRKVESLELVGIFMEDGEKVVLGESLREISVMCGDLGTLILFQYIKSLHLTSLEVSGEDVELFLHNCPLLEKLILRCIDMTSDIEVCSPSLKLLDIFWCRGGKSIKVSAPNLTIIRFDDTVGQLLFKNVPRLVDATFEVRTSEFVMHHFASAASFHISQVQFLEIRLPRPEVFWRTNAFPQMPNLKKLDISSPDGHSLQQVTRLIWAYHRLEKLQISFTGYVKAQIANVGRSPHQHLKELHLDLLYGKRVNDQLMELVSYVSINCVALRRIHIFGPDDSAPRLLQTLVPNHVQLSFS